MKSFASCLLGVLLLTVPAALPAEDLLRVGGFGRDITGVVAEGKGFFKAEGIKTEYTQVRASVELMQNFVDGKLDVIHTTADNPIAWAEGQGADHKTHDFILFLGGRKGLTMELVVGPEFKTFADLKGSGKIFAVDAYNTGYAPVLVYILDKHGVKLRKDYDMKPLGAGGARVESILKGETIGGMIGLNEELKKRGFHVLARTQDYLPTYAVAVGAARRDWAKQHEGLLVRYIRALIRSTDWTLDPTNKAEALRVIQAVLHNKPGQAAEMYGEATDAQLGLIPRGKMDREGVRVILQIRQVMGEMRPPLPSPDKYVDEQYYRKAIASLVAESGTR